MKILTVINACSSSIQNHNMTRAKRLYNLALGIANTHGCNEREKELLKFLRQYFYDEHGNQIYYDKDLNI